MALQQLQKVRLASLGVLLLVLGAGVLMGLAWDSRADAMAAPVTVAPDTTEAEAQREPRRERQPMYAQVGLTPEQRARVDSIVMQHRAAMKGLDSEFQAAYRPRYRSILESTRSSIRGVMTPVQVSQY